ncbi:hypothetical protein KP806_24255 [Paenibacillus sp. N4]|uniref:hypothetical protein n=1 Tax=Paenibacillus vietnamensis TaxID=2590547 RepID=UPI001CD10019|nr:hypothetical protein [Paenibacillus vietnamensis]MCA0758173.1 hypothetical protein [Paenibacillus vietnamensis]
MGFRISIRTQFTFIAPDRTLHCILSSIAEKGVNINGFDLSKKTKRCYLVRLVLGSVEAESANDLRILRKVLRSYCVRFIEKKVIQVHGIAPGVPGGLGALFGALSCKVRVIAIYTGENNRIFVDVSDLKKAARILSQKNVPQFRKKCHL